MNVDVRGMDEEQRTVVALMQAVALQMVLFGRKKKDWDAIDRADAKAAALYQKLSSFRLTLNQNQVTRRNSKSALCA